MLCRLSISKIAKRRIKAGFVTTLFVTKRLACSGSKIYLRKKKINASIACSASIAVVLGPHLRTMQLPGRVAVHQKATRYLGKKITCFFT